MDALRKQTKSFATGRDAPLRTVFYLPHPGAWHARCATMAAVGFREVEPFNPY